MPDRLHKSGEKDRRRTLIQIQREPDSVRVFPERPGPGDKSPTARTDDKS